MTVSRDIEKAIGSLDTRAEQRLAYLEAREEQLVAVLRPLLRIVEAELADEPGAGDPESWRRAIRAARAALHLDEVTA